MLQALKTNSRRNNLWSTSATALALVVCMTAAACDDEAQMARPDAATSDTTISDAGIFDGANVNDVGPGGSDTLSATFIVGVAATGSALPVGSPVEASCVAGKIASKTGAGGVFTLPTDGLTFPCLLRAHYGNGEQQKTLYSAATGAGTVNITPLTHAIVTKALAGDPGPAFAMPMQAILSGLVAKLPSMQAQLRKLLANQGLGAVVALVPGDFFTGPLRPASPTLAADAHDKLLDAVITRFGQTEALVFEFSAALFDLGLSARVDWTQCKEAPRSSSEGGYYATGCNSRAVLFSSSPFSYASPQFVDGTILMRLSTTTTELQGGDCLLQINYGESNPPSDQRPGWAGPGAIYTLDGWNASARNSLGKFIGLGSGNGTLAGGTKGIVTAAGLEPGSQVMTVYTEGGRGAMRFSLQGPLTEVTMTDNSTCLWNAN